METNGLSLLTTTTNAKQVWESSSVKLDVRAWSMESSSQVASCTGLPLLSPQAPAVRTRMTFYEHPSGLCSTQCNQQKVLCGHPVLHLWNTCKPEVWRKPVVGGDFCFKCLACTGMWQTLRRPCGLAFTHYLHFTDKENNLHKAPQVIIRKSNSLPSPPTQST